MERLAGNPADRARMAESAKKDAERFSLDTMIDRTLQLYREALARKGRAGAGSD
jgi:hypothetical protein